MFFKDLKKDIFTVPNILSLFRLLLIPVYIVIYLNAEDTGDFYLAAAILAVSCLTDMIDGKIARHFNVISTLGKVLDPFADKATQFALIICLALEHPVLWILIGIFVIKESFQLIAGSLTLRKRKILKRALLSGKICTAVLFISLILMVMLPQMDDKIIVALTAVDAAVMLIAFLDYARVYFLKAPEFQSIDTPPQ